MKDFRVSIITQDFYPMHGGIASYIMQIYNKYLSNVNVNIIIPEDVGKGVDYSDFNFSVNTAKFNPFVSHNDRLVENEEILKLLTLSKPDIILFGYLRSHPEVGLRYKVDHPECKLGILTHAKEVIIDESVTELSHNDAGTHKGYLKSEIDFYKMILNKFDYVFSVSNYTAELLKSQGIKNRINILYPSLDISGSVEICPKENIGFSKDDMLLLSVGRLTARKGQSKVIEAINNLKPDFPNLKYLIVGNGPERTYLENMIKSRKLSDRIVILDDVSDRIISKYYAACDIFVLPNTFIPPNDVEGFGIVFLEANLYGKPVIAGKSGGVIEAVQHKKTGLLINPDDSSELEQSIVTLINNPNLRTQLGEYGRNRVLKEFNSTPSNKLLKLFTEGI
jgi:glycosyltransferase involved in cell wall biosynthesis